MRLYKRNGIWYIETARGKAYSTKLRDEAEARKVFEKVELLQVKGRVIQLTRRDTIKISEFAEQYCERPEIEDATILKDRLVLKLFREAVGDLQMSRITDETVEDFKNKCRARNLSDESLLTYLGHLKAALRWANHKKRRYVIEVPEIILPKPAEKPIEFRILSDEQVQSIIDKAFSSRPKESEFNRYFGALICVLADTGCRRNEGLAGLWEKCNMTTAPHWLEVRGKGNKWRRVYLPERSANALNNIKKTDRSIGRIFPDWHPDSVSHWFAEIVKGIEGIHCRLHDLRHTWCTRALEKGMTLEVVRTLAGHESIETTLLYAKALEDRRAREAAMIAYSGRRQ